MRATRSFVRLACLVAAVCHGALMGADARSCASTAVSAGPVLDGRLDDPCWQGTPEHTGFVEPVSAAAVSCQTTFRVVHDATGLYFGVRAQDPDARQARAKHLDHDGPLWGDDCVEIFIDPGRSGMGYVQVIVNCRGAIWDGLATQMGVSMDAAHETGAHAAAQIAADHWSAEVAIPFAGLALANDAGEQWGLNVAREKKTKPPRLSCWAPTGAHKFGVPGRFGVLAVAGVDVPRFVWAVGPVRFAQPKFLDGGEVAGELQFQVRSLGSSPGRVQVHATLEDAGGLHTGNSTSVTVAAGAAAGLRVPVQLRSRGACRARFRIVDAGSGDLLHVEEQRLTIACAPVELELLAPWYRDAIFATCPVDRIEARATVHGEAGEVAVRATLRRGEELLAARRLTGQAGQPMAFTFPAAGLAQGEYLLRVERQAGPPAAAERVVRVLPRVEGEVCLDRRGRLLVDGEPFFAWGFMSGSPQERLARAGFNTIHTYIAYYIHRDRDMPGWLDQAHALGMKVVMYPYPGEIGLHICRDKKRFKDRTMERIAEFVRTYRNHPAVLGWYLCDDPRGAVHRQEMVRVGKLVAATDPHHPCVVLDNTGRSVAGLAEAGEVLWVDPYPGFAKDGPPRMPLTTVSIAMDDMIAGSRGLLRHYWIAPQAFNWGGWGGEKAKTERGPTYQEERAMTYLAIIHRAQGVVYFALKYADKEPGLAKGLFEQLGPEIRSLMPVLLHGEDVADARVVTSPGERSVHVRVLRRGAQTVVIAVNPELEAVSAAVTVPGLQVQKLQVLSEGRSVPVRAGAFTDRFAACATHVYVAQPLGSGR